MTCSWVEDKVEAFKKEKRENNYYCFIRVFLQTFELATITYFVGCLLELK